MSAQGTAYVLFGLALVVLFVIIIGFYYSGKRKKKVEEAKYRIFDDED
jgi:cbb3-type cytochrome oxidase subunit 3